MKKLLSNVLVMCLVFSLTGCASLFTKTTYPVTINTTPSDAKIVITDKSGFDVFVGNSPAVVPLKSSSGFFSKGEYYVKVQLPGYQEYITTITADIEGWYFANILIGGLIGMLIIDPATGAMWTIRQKQINIDLRPEGNHTLQILDLKDVPEEMKSQLVRVN